MRREQETFIEAMMVRAITGWGNNLLNLESNCLFLMFTQPPVLVSPRLMIPHWRMTDSFSVYEGGMVRVPYFPTMSVNN